MSEERWTAIEGFLGYSISDHGRVRNDRFGRLMALRRNKQGNIYVGLFDGDRQHSVSVARLVGQHFLVNKYYDPEFNATPLHIDGDLSNNIADNLLMRPRWYAIKYQLQFPLGSTLYRNDILEETTMIRFRNSQSAMLYFGALEFDILRSMLHDDVCPHTDDLCFKRLNEN